MGREASVSDHAGREHDPPEVLPLRQALPRKRACRLPEVNCFLFLAGLVVLGPKPYSTYRFEF
jgi:hypothetical protein